MPPARRAASPPDATRVSAAALHEAALTHLARYAATEAGLRRVLERRIDRWARAQEGAATASPATGAETPSPIGAEAVAETVAAARAAARAVVARLAAARALNDAEFAAARARSLTRAGRSRQAIAAHLAAKGVARETARAALPAEPEAELVAALIQARRRRLGPFRSDEADAAIRRKELGVLARAGFAQAVAAQALGTDRLEAEALIAQARDGG